MDIPSRRSQAELRRHGSTARRLQRRESSGSNASYVSEIEFATAEPFSGVAAESVPTSTTGFAYRGSRQRQGSISSFTYFQDDGEPPEYVDDEAIVDADRDLEAGARGLLRRKSSVRSRASRAASDQPLVRRRESASDVQEHEDGGSFSQKLYIEAEDLTIVIAGFTTSTLGLLLYTAICLATAGIGYLVFRLQASRQRKTPAKTRQNQWGEFSVHYVTAEEYGHAMSTVFNTLDGEKQNGYRYGADAELKLLRFLDYRYMRLIYHPTLDKFVPNNDWWDPQWTDVKALRAGLDSEEREPRSQVFGKNMIEVGGKSIPQLMLDEAFHPFYIFQIASLILWSMDEYYYYAAAIFLISVVSITTTIIETRSTMTRLRDISRFECDVRVLRNGFWRQSTSAELVPGDVFEVSDPALSQLPCDSLLLAGDCIVNESMLTGESIPVSKMPLTDEMLTYVALGATSIHPLVARHFLFCGTKIIRALALAMVVRTGFNTTKGALVRSMLFPKPSGFKFYRDSFRYIAVMGGIALLGFIASVVNFVRLGLAWHLIIVRALDLITIVVPPALPATLTIGTNFALARLKKSHIFCISPQRVNVAGKLDVVCFDKTGTLTEDGLDVLGVRLVQHPEIRFGELLAEHHEVLPWAKYDRDPTTDYRVNKTMLYAMATCHSLRLVDDELIGDPLDLKMFQFTGWSFEEASAATAHLADVGSSHQMPPAVARPPPGMEYEMGDEGDGHESRLRVELAVVKSFEFASHLRRASVVVRQSRDPGVTVYVKGAPEVMRDICMPSSMPADFDDLLSFYTHKGFRVIACASKYISRLAQHQVEQMERAEAESRLQLTGFIVFENKLKEATAGVIAELNQARIRNVMCTGDNILTAISVARECDLLDRDTHCFVPHFVRGDKLDPMAQISWESVDNSRHELDEHTLLPMPMAAEQHGGSPFDRLMLADYSLAVTGDAFRWMMDFGPAELVQRMLVKGQVFARMSPDEKHELVEKLQAIDYTCGFCGDGANDCGALKAADVGVSLSEAEASVAAPFTSHVFDISCVPTLIKEGRAALVTSFCCFKYMSLYSAIQFTTVSFLYASASNLGDFQFLFIDLALILPIAIFMGWTGAYPELSTKRPTASLVSRKVLTPLLGHIGLCVLVQLVVFETVQRQPWYQPPRLDREKSSIDNSQNTALFLVSCFQYALSGVVLSVGPPFRQPVVTNAPFCVTLVIALAISLYLLLDPAQAVKRFMDLTDMSLGYELFLLAIALVGFATASVAEAQVFPLLAKQLGRLMRRLQQPGWRKQRKRYKTQQKQKKQTQQKQKNKQTQQTQQNKQTQQKQICRIKILSRASLPPDHRHHGLTDGLLVPSGGIDDDGDSEQQQQQPLPISSSPWPRREYEYICKLGEGTFGEVSKARSKSTGQVVALKKILMHNEKDGFPITALREIKLLKQLDHVNILKLTEMAVERPKNASKRTSMFMVTPYMDHDLAGLLENPSVRFTEAQIKCYMQQLLAGTAYLHASKILHRDMKAANLLINNRGILQIADFGLARPYDDEAPQRGKGGGEATREYTTLVVTRWYRPPELLLQLRKYTTAIDMWGVGCVFGEMFQGKPILAGTSDLHQAHIIFDLVGSPTDESMPGWRDLPGVDGNLAFAERAATLRAVFKDQPAEAVSLLERLLTLDWRKRINAIDALEHPYFTTPPLPARPGDLPSFDDSHELDRRKFRDQKNKPPPAPAGGSVGIQAHGEQADYRPRQPRTYSSSQDSRRAPYDAGPRLAPSVHPNDDLYSRRPQASDSSLPPRPPPAEIEALEGYRGPAPYRDRDWDRDRVRDERVFPPRSRLPPTNPTLGPRNNADTFATAYSGADHSPRLRRQPLPRDDYDYDYDYDRDRDRDRDRDYAAPSHRRSSQDYNERMYDDRPGPAPRRDSRGAPPAAATASAPLAMYGERRRSRSPRRMGYDARRDDIQYRR
ncbi:hypothetical protein DV737_g202, partial [Chaetothyriales sp. CBS 132003]